MEDFLFGDNASLPEADFETKVPSDFRSYYTKGNDGTYSIGEAHAGTAKLFDGLRSNLKTKSTTLAATQAESKTRREALESFTKIAGVATAEELKAKLDDYNAKIASGSKDKINPQEIRDAIMAEVTPQLAAKDDELKAMSTTLSDHLIDGDATRSLAEHKGNIKVLLPHIKAQSKVIKTEDGKFIAVALKPDGTPRVGADGGYVPISKLVEELRADKDFANNFEGNSNTGGGNRNQDHRQQNRETQRPVNNGQTEMRGVAKIAAATAR